MSEMDKPHLEGTTPIIHTPDQRVRVFISSTLDELAPERAAARQAILELHLTPVFFEAGARPYPPQELYRAYLAQSDIFVGLYWQRYGWVAPNMEVSGLEDEYRHSDGKPRLIYVKTPAPAREPRLQTLLDRIRDDGISYQKFGTPDELRELLANDLAEVLTDRFSDVHQELDVHQEPLADHSHPTLASGPPASATQRLPIWLEKHFSLVALLALLVVLVVSGVVIGLPLLQGRNQVSSQPSNTHAALGQLVFLSSGQVGDNSSQGIADTISLQMQIQRGPAAGKQYYAWLLPEQSNAEAPPILLGTIIKHEQVGQMTYRDPQHTNMLSSTSRLLVTEQDASITPLTPSTDPSDWRYVASIADIHPSGTPYGPYSLLDHIRHLLAKEPTLESHGLHGGLVNWLQRNTNKLVEWSLSARDAWQSGNTADLGLMRQQLTRILIYLDGISYAPAELPKNIPYAGLVDAPTGNIGLLPPDSQLNAFSVVTHIDFHLQGVAASPGASTSQQQETAKILAVMNHINAWLKQVRDDDRRLLMMSDQQLQQSAALTLLNDLQMNAIYASSGQIDQATGARQEGGQWVYQETQHLASMEVMLASS